jgi:uncharacterized membrane protein YqjE
MIQRLVDDLKTSSADALRLSALAVALGFAAFLTAGFVCAAVFIAVLQSYGMVEACLAGAAVFLVVTLIMAAWYLLYQRAVRRHAMEAEKSAITAALTDPAVLAIGLQVVRAIGVRRLLPLLAVGGIALGLSSVRRSDASDEDED